MDKCKMDSILTALTAEGYLEENAEGHVRITVKGYDQLDYLAVKAYHGIFAGELDGSRYTYKGNLTPDELLDNFLEGLAEAYPQPIVLLAKLTAWQLGEMPLGEI